MRIFNTQRQHTAISPRLLAAAGLVALFVAIPFGYILIRAAGSEPETWARLLENRRLLGLLTNTLSLMLLVTTGALVTGVSMAWLTERTDLPGRAVFRAGMIRPCL